jgi:hypothetical protein
MVTLTDNEIAQLKDTTTTNRYLVVYNGTSDTIYPALIGYDTDGTILTDKDTNLPSGFILESKKYKILTLPRYVISGRIIARTGCKMVSGLYGQGYDGYLCDTGDCHQSYDTSSGKSEDVTYLVSNKGLLCNVKGGAAPATILEFSFTSAAGTDNKGRPLIANTDYYDVSQVDGNNLSAQMEPIINQNMSGGTGDFWCQKAGCSATLVCPPELRVYDNGNQIACQSICAAMGGIKTNMKPDRTLDPNGTQHYPGGTPPGPFNNFTGNLKKFDPKAYQILVDMFLTNYYWDPSAKNSGDPNRPWTQTGKWVPDMDKSKCPLDCKAGVCTVPKNCIPTETLVCCKAEPGNQCGDPGATPPKNPVWNGPSDQGCSPYVTSYNTPDYAPHLCWSESWPTSSDGKNYHEIFKNQCKDAYSWAFDDFSSTYTCNSATGTPPVHYFIQFYPYEGTPDTLDLTPQGPTPSFWTLTHILIAGGAVLLLILFFVLRRK